MRLLAGKQAEFGSHSQTYDYQSLLKKLSNGETFSICLPNKYFF